MLMQRRQSLGDLDHDLERFARAEWSAASQAGGERFAGQVAMSDVTASFIVLHVQESRRATGAPWPRVLATVATAVPGLIVQIAALAVAITWALAPWIAGAT